jgi:hypothetical protein
MRTARVWQFGVLFPVLVFAGATTARAQVCNGSWTFGDDGFGAYRLEAEEPCRVQLGTFGDANPTLLLEVGKRYHVRVVHHTDYPLEVIAKGASPAQDRVLLSMGSDAGAFASDPEVDWQDDGQGVVRFTLTGRLFRAMSEGGLSPGYRSRAQAGTMRGDFAVTWSPPFFEGIARAPIVIDFEKVAPGLVVPVDLQPDRLSVAARRTRQIDA